MDVEVAVIGGGAAGIAAARRLHAEGIGCVIIEARPRLGGRAWTVSAAAGWPIDLGCGWLHSGNRNPWRRIAEDMGYAIHRNTASRLRRASNVNFSKDDQASYASAYDALQVRLEAAAGEPQDVAVSALLRAGCRWNELLNAVSTYISGAELDRVSAHDLHAYADTGVNWRIPAGYGTAILAHAGDVPRIMDCPVSAIDHAGKRLCITTRQGEVVADRAIVTLPSRLIAEEAIAFSPALPDKAAAAAGLPLGLADKLFLSLENAEDLEAETRVFGRIDRTGTGTYHMRPFGRPLIEAYFAGTLAADLEQGGEEAFSAFALEELTGLFGSDFANRVRPVAMHRWGADPWSGGSYSYALPGMAGCRQRLAEPVEGRLFFAGEACSTHDYSTAHGAYRTGIAAAELVIEARRA